MTLRRLLLTLLIIPLLLSGCWSRREINDRVFVSVMLVDAGKDADDIELSLGFPLSGRLSTVQMPSSSDGKPYMGITKTAESVAAAYRKIQTDISRQINWGHTRVVIIGERMAKRGLRPILEFISQQPTFQLKAYLFILEGEAKSFGETIPTMERFPSEMLREMASQHTIMDTTVKDLLSGGPYLEDGMIGMIKLKRQKMPSEDGKVGAEVENGGAALIKNGRLTGYYDVSEMRGALWVKGKMENAVITIPSPTDGKLIDFMVVHSKAKIKVKPGEGQNKVVYQLEVQAFDDILSSNSSINLQEVEQLQLLSGQLKEKLAKRIKQSLEKSQTLGIDCMQLGKYLEWYIPDYWERWKNDWHHHFQHNVEFQVDAKVEIKRPGGIRVPYWRKVGQQE